MRAEKIRRGAGYALLLSVYAFLISPLVVVAAASLDTQSTFAARFPPHSIGLRWYFDIPQKYWEALGVSLTAAVLAAVISGALGTLAALGIVRSKLAGTELLRAFFRMPL